MPSGRSVLCVLPTHPTSPLAVNISYALRPEPAHHAQATPASAYTREQRLLRRYRELLYAPTCDVEQLIATVWGPHLTERQKWGLNDTHGRVDHLDYNVPALLQRLRWDEQEAIGTLLAAGDLVGCIREALRLEHRLTQRENDPRLLLNDDWRLKAAGMGRLSREAYGHPLGALLVLTPAPVPAPAPRLSVRRRVKRRAHVRHHHAPARQLCFWP